MKKKNLFLTTVMVMAMVSTLVGCAGSGSAPVQQQTAGSSETADSSKTTSPSEMPTEGIPDNYVMLIGGSSTEGTFYQFIVGSVDLVEQYGSGNWQVMPFATGGSAEGFARLETGECNVNHAAGVSFACARDGEYGYDHAFSKDMYLLQCDSPSYFNICTRAGSPYNSLADLKGAKCSMGTMNSALYGVGMKVLSDLGIDGESYFNMVYLSPSESMAALAEGTIDVFISHSAPGGVITQIAESASGLKAIALTDEEIEAATAADPMLLAGVIPAGTYKGNDEDVKIVYDRCVLVATEELPENVAYQYLKIVTEHHDELAAINPTLFGDATPELTIDSYYGTIPLHPGAEKYYRELGLID